MTSIGNSKCRKIRVFNGGGRWGTEKPFTNKKSLTKTMVVKVLRIGLMTSVLTYFTPLTRPVSRPLFVRSGALLVHVFWVLPCS